MSEGRTNETLIPKYWMPTSSASANTPMIAGLPIVRSRRSLAEKERINENHIITKTDHVIPKNARLLKKVDVEVKVLKLERRANTELETMQKMCIPKMQTKRTGPILTTTTKTA
jgi:hypothetical protein